jgi:sirohydrochlorin ferrochelatase
VLTALALFVLPVACARKDLKSEMGRVRSWTATTKLAAELRGVGSTNRAVTHQLLERARETHAQQERELARLATTDSQRVAARLLLDSLQRGIGRLQQVAP